MPRVGQHSKGTAFPVTDQTEVEHRSGKSINAPDLRSQDVQKKSDQQLAQTIAEGKGNMPSFKRLFDAQQVQAFSRLRS